MDIDEEDIDIYDEEIEMDEQEYVYEDDGGEESKDGEFAQVGERIFEDSKEISRFGGPRLVGQELEQLEGGGELQKRVYEKLKSPESEFEKNAIGFISRYSDVLKKIQSTEGLKNSILKIVSKIPKIKYKSPRAFVLGFCMLKGKYIKNNELDDRDESELEYLYDRIGKDEGIREVDILRYAFLAQRVVNKKK